MQFSTIIRRKEQFDQESATHGKIAQAINSIEHQFRQLLHAEWPVPARGALAIRPEAVKSIFV